MSVQKADIYFLVVLEAEILRLGSSIIKFYYRLFSWFAESLLLTMRLGNREGGRENAKAMCLVFLLIRALIPS